MGKDRESRDKRELNKYRSKRAIAINKMILELTAELDEIGYRIETIYRPGAGWTSEIVNNNTGENHEQRLRAV
jgi:hypothetical protein|tara:strand:- start:404 stop:622 length:219 start_codon:yes stop_codon:yes gene_type:complete